MDKSDILAIAHLARLGVGEQELAGYTQELTNILDFVEQLGSVETEGVVPLAHPLDANQRLRPDVVTESDQRERFQAHAPATDTGLYLVPKVIE